MGNHRHPSLSHMCSGGRHQFIMMARPTTCSIHEALLRNLIHKNMGMSGIGDETAHKHGLNPCQLAPKDHEGV
eukprot:1153248-Pelagomonas_calceolata.AAC.1